MYRYQQGLASKRQPRSSFPKQLEEGKGGQDAQSCVHLNYKNKIKCIFYEFITYIYQMIFKMRVCSNACE